MQVYVPGARVSFRNLAKWKIKGIRQLSESTLAVGDSEIAAHSDAPRSGLRLLKLLLNLMLVLFRSECGRKLKRTRMRCYEGEL